MLKISLADRGTILIKHIEVQQDLDRRPGSDLLGRLGAGQRPKFNFFQNLIMLYINLKGMTHAATLVGEPEIQKLEKSGRKVAEF